MKKFLANTAVAAARLAPAMVAFAANKETNK